MEWSFAVEEDKGGSGEANLEIAETGYMELVDWWNMDKSETVQMEEDREGFDAVDEAAQGPGNSHHHHIRRCDELLS